MTHAELLRKHATDATNEGGVWFSGEYMTMLAIMAESIEDENAQLRQQLADATESMGRVEERCAKLRELVLELWDGYMDPPCEECHLKDTPTCADCPICAMEASVIDRMHELGIEVD